jgi:hypothetical protein
MFMCYRWTVSAPITGIGGSDGVAVTAAGLLLSVVSNNRVIHVRRDGSHLGVIGSQGSGRGQFDSPCGVAVRGDTAWVADYNNKRLVRLTIRGDGGLTWVEEVDVGDGVYDVTLCGEMMYVTLYDTEEVLEVRGRTIIRRHVTPAHAAGRDSWPWGITCSHDTR